uniref:Protein kinase domain-containing protein n=1 Tax=Angiostrongylus cantonensis TaxID=6313 RepID=A0A0K0DJV5_ANGCA
MLPHPQKNSKCNVRSNVRLFNFTRDRWNLVLMSNGRFQMFLSLGGALDVYLRKHKQTIDKRERLYMTMGAAWGMEYLHRNCILYSDIAARNCLYDNKKTVKISDFGLSRRGTTYRMKTAKKMAIKWMAPESVSKFTFSLKTDVYSYRVVHL